MAKLKCPKEEYDYLTRLRDRLITAKIDLRKVERDRDIALKEGRLEEAERESKLLRSYLGLTREIESVIQELEERCFGGSAK